MTKKAGNFDNFEGLNLSYKRKCSRFFFIIPGNTPQRYKYVDNEINYIFFVVNILCNNIYIYCRIEK